MKPSLHLKGNGTEHLGGALSQVWWKYGERHEGTIPIKRQRKYCSRRIIPFAPHVKRFSEPCAVASVTNGNYFEAHASIGVWNPAAEDSEQSVSQICLSSRHGDYANTIKAGWMADDYQDTGCYNLDCPGFVQVDCKVALGSPIQPISIYSGQQHDIYVSIIKDQVTGHWLLRIKDVNVGFWPKDLHFSREIVSTKSVGCRTSAQMGSGHFPFKGFGKVSFFRNLKFLDGFIERDPENL
ncbi:hypothetical protein EUGRSUZ_J02896 [Eucalyptus grandis]|uniref:Uncharacterized protein n=2 Tax=Eucalyptus grandis TaxID=71139 RepID=A0ACC3JA16_EUCGR|nr:hypothetical protein EUGRSUZ_J02896 [Eucalyptus grandis]